MKSFLNTTASIVALLAATTGTAFAFGTDLPEPGSMALSGLALAAAIYVLRRNRK